MDIDFPILASVARRPLHPYALLHDLNAMGLEVARSTLYRRIDALVAGGDLASSDVKGSDGRTRRMLAVTSRGMERLTGEAARVLQREPLGAPRFAIAVACAERLDRSDLPAILRGRMATAARALTRQEQALRSLDGSAGFWARASHEREVAHTRTDLEWLQSIVRRRQEAVEAAQGEALAS